MDHIIAFMASVDLFLVSPATEATRTTPLTVSSTVSMFTCSLSHKNALLMMPFMLLEPYAVKTSKAETFYHDDASKNRQNINLILSS